MSPKNQDDSWSLLASELGLEASAEEFQAPVDQEADQTEETATTEVAAASDSSDSAELIDVPAPTEPMVSPEPASDAFGMGILSEEPEQEADPAQPKESKKTFFGRFPKINLFGTSTRESFDSVVEGAKAPSLSGKSFTSKTLEKLPVSSRKSEPENVAPEEPKESRKPKEVREPEESKMPPRAKEKGAGGQDPWSQIASQVGAISSGGPKDVEKEGTKSDSSISDSKKRNTRRRGRGRAAMASDSIFDESPRETEESLALKDLIENDPADSTDEEVRRLTSIFEGEDDDIPPRRSARRRGRRDSDETTVADPIVPEKRVKEESPKKEARGRRGSRYERREESATAYEPVEDGTLSEGAAWDIEEESKPVERSSRKGRRRGRRSEETDDRAMESTFDREETVSEPYSESATTHRNIPSWDDAIEMLIDGNIARRGQRNSESRRGRR